MIIPRIELVYDPDCPNVDRARSAIRRALRSVGAAANWQEWRRDSAETPQALRGLGSPSVLVNGHDVGCDEGQSAEANANSCRIYTDECGCICGAPSTELVLSAFSRGEK